MNIELEIRPFALFVRVIAGSALCLSNLSIESPLKISDGILRLGIGLLYLLPVLDSVYSSSG